MSPPNRTPLHDRHDNPKRRPGRDRLLREMAVGLGGHGYGRRYRAGCDRAGFLRLAGRVRICLGQSGHRGADLGDGLADDDPDRLRLPDAGRRAPEGPDHHPHRELAGQTLLDGTAGRALLRACLCRLAAARGRTTISGRCHHSRRRALHRHGLRLVAADPRRRELHPGPGRCERPDHGRRFRPHRRPPAGRDRHHRALGHAPPLGRALCGDPADRRLADPQGIVARQKRDRCRQGSQ